MATSLGTLALKFTTDTTGVQRGTTQVHQMLGGMGRSVMGSLGLAGGIAGVTAALTHKLIDLGERGIRFVIQQLTDAAERVDRLAKVSDRLEIPVDRVQRLAHAADLAGVDFGTLTKAVQKMLVTAGTGGLAVDQRFAQLAQKISAIEDPGQRAAAAVKVFGKSGAELLNVLAELPGNLERAGDLMHSFDLALSRLDASGVEEMNDAWSDLKFVMEGLFNKLLAEIAPAIAMVFKDILDLLKQLAQTLGKTKISWELIRDVAITAGAVIVNSLTGAIGQLRTMVAWLGVAHNGFRTLEAAAKGNWQAVQAIGRENQALFKEAAAGFQQFRDSLSFKAGFDFVRRTEQFLMGLEAKGKRRGGLGGDVGEKSSFKFGAALERGSMEAVAAVTQAGGNPLGAVAENTKQMLLVLRPVKEDISRLARRSGAAPGLVASNFP